MLPDLLADPRVHEAIARALEEDVGPGDATTLALVDPGIQATGEILARQACRVAGGGVAAAVLKRIDPSIVCETIVPDGCEAPIGGPILRFRGPAAAILTGERTALNFMQRMSGIASMTRRYVEAVRGTGPSAGPRRRVNSASSCGAGSSISADQACPELQRQDGQIGVIVALETQELKSLEQTREPARSRRMDANANTLDANPSAADGRRKTERRPEIPVGEQGPSTGPQKPPNLADHRLLPRDGKVAHRSEQGDHSVEAGIGQRHVGHVGLNEPGVWIPLSRLGQHRAVQVRSRQVDS